MKWPWPFSGCVREGRRKLRKGSVIGNAGPDFLCIGAHKAGTTWLYQQLDAHPDFWMPPIKELHYFDQLSRVQRASSPRCRDERDIRFLERLQSLSSEPDLDLDNYAELFEPKASLISGDISPNYSTLSNEIIRQVVEYFPNLKVVFLARDPVERVWSHLSMEVNYHQIDSFDVTNVKEVERKLFRRGMLLRSYPSAVVARWKRFVHPEQFRVFFFDDLQSNPAELRRSILRFLGADPDKSHPSLRVNYNSWTGMKKLPLSNEVRAHLAKFFKTEIRTCAARLGGPARDWPARYGL